MNWTAVQKITSTNPIKGFIVWIAKKNKLELEDFQQDVLCELKEKECADIGVIKNAIRALAERQSYSRIDTIPYNDEIRYDGRVNGVWFHDGTRLNPADAMVCELIHYFQPDSTLDVFEGRLYINGE